MPIIHYFSDREQKKLNIKIFSIFLIIIGSILATYFIASANIKPVNNNLSSENIPNESINQISNKLCIDSDIDSIFIKKIEAIINENNLDLTITDISKDCTLEIARNPENINPYTLITSKVYVPVTNVLSNIESITKDELVSSLNPQVFKTYSVIWNSEVDNYLRSKYSFGVGQTTYVDNEIDKKLGERNKYIAIIPFDKVNPKYKIIKIDNYDLINDDISITSYPLTDSYWIKGNEEQRKQLVEFLSKVLPQINYDRSKFTKLYLTGSSLVGADKYHVEIYKGKKPDYMLDKIRTTFSKDDLLHVSNEVSIYNSCIQQVNSTYLCSKENGFAPFKSLGVDVVGVTGNHIMDFGYDTFIDTLDWYRNNKIKSFGGGINEQQAHTPALISKNGIKFAFIGYNFIPPYSYYSSGNRGGSANVSLSMMRRDIANAKSLADIVIVDMNWGDEQQTEIDKTFIENADFAHQYGADIINGVNSYSALGFDIYKNGSTFYGLGGFLNPVAKNGIVVEHIFYEKKYFGINLIPIIYDKDGTLNIATNTVKTNIINSIYNQSRIIYDK